MEQKKTLWIIAAVGAFLLVVLGTAGILYSPARNPTPAIASVAPVEKAKPATPSTGWTNQIDVQPPVPAPSVGDMIVLADNTTVYNLSKADDSSATTIDLNALKNGYLTEAQPQTAAQPQNINITVNVPEVKEPAPSAVEKEPVKAPEKVVVEKVVKAPKSEKPAPAPKSEAKSSVKVTVNGNASVTVKEEPKKTQFWVQVAAYSNKKGAENARSVLDSNKIPADVFTYQDNKSKLYYRIRVGPYTTKSEAEYWRSRIVKIDEFVKAESFVTSTTN
jgi:cell division protein FtsN